MMEKRTRILSSQMVSDCISFFVIAGKKCFFLHIILKIYVDFLYES